jgi:hypothetical protein
VCVCVFWGVYKLINKTRTSGIRKGQRRKEKHLTFFFLLAKVKSSKAELTVGSTVQISSRTSFFLFGL